MVEVTCKNSDCNTIFCVTKITGDDFCSDKCRKETRSFRSVLECLTVIHPKKELDGTEEMPIQNLGNEDQKEGPSYALREERTFNNQTLTRPMRIESNGENKSADGVQEMPKEVENSKETITREIPPDYHPSCKNENADMIRQEDFSVLCETLHQERSASISQLNDSARHLIELAQSMAAARKDDNGEIIQRASDYNVSVAVRCFSEARNMMKTKLEYMKFARELIRRS